MASVTPFRNGLPNPCNASPRHFRPFWLPRNLWSRLLVGCGFVVGKLCILGCSLLTSGLGVLVGCGYLYRPLGDGCRVVVGFAHLSVVLSCVLRRSPALRDCLRRA